MRSIITIRNIRIIGKYKLITFRKEYDINMINN